MNEVDCGDNSCSGESVKQLIKIILFLSVSGVALADFQVWKISRSREKIIIKLEEDEFLNKGDQLYLQNDDGKCWAKVIKLKRPYALASAQECRFKINQGNRLVHSDYFWKRRKKTAGAENAGAGVISNDPATPPPRPYGWQRRMGYAWKNPYGGVLLSFGHSLPPVGNKISVELTEREDISFPLSSSFELKGEYLLLRPELKKTGISLGTSRELGRTVETPMKDLKLTLTTFYSNLFYFPYEKFYFYGGVNYTLPKMDQFQPSENAIFKDFAMVGGLGLQVGATMLLKWNIRLSLEYKRMQFFSTQSEHNLERAKLDGDGNCKLSDEKAEDDCIVDSIGVYGAHGIGLFLTYRAF